MPRHDTEAKRQKLMALIREAGPDGITSKQASAVIGTCSDVATLHLNALIDEGLVEKNHAGRGGPWCRYGLPGIRKRYEEREMTPRQRRKIIESRRYRERKKLERENFAELPIVRIFRLASEAPPLKVNAPASVWALGEYL